VKLDVRIPPSSSEALPQIFEAAAVKEELWGKPRQNDDLSADVWKAEEKTTGRFQLSLSLD
jgi:hypothetical protein